MQSKVLFTLALSILISFVKVEVSSERIRATYQEDCNATVRCDSRQALTCRDGICECLMNETMTFDKDKKSCVVLVGEKCSFTALEIDNSEKNGSTQEKMWKEELPCVQNAKCSLKGFCSCEDLFMESSNGSCQPKLLYENSCKSSSECRKDLHLICNEGKCRCNPDYSLFDNLKGTCVSKAGTNCENLQICTENSQCDYEKEKNYPHNRISNEKKCICNAGLYSSAQGTCEIKKKFGEACDKNDSCFEELDLICENKTCKCDPSKAVSDKDNKSCLVLAGSLCVDSYKCANELGEKKCVIGATCERNGIYVVDPRSPNGYGYEQSACRCSSDTYQTSNKTCKKKRGFHESCSDTKECSNQGSFPFVCLDGKCQCSGNGTVYDPIKKKCAISQNDECSSDDCVLNAKCTYEYHPVRGYLHYCQCISGTSPTKNGFCHGSHGSACESDHAPCNRERGLICQDKQCQCALGEHQEFSKETESCITLVRGPCGKNYSSPQCVPHAECVEVEGEHECKCKSGFLPVGRKCELGFGQKCDNLNVTCDRIGGLKCVEGTCKCGVRQVYEKEKFRCRGKVGSMCDLGKGEDGFCEDGTLCKPFRDVGRSNIGICSKMEVSFEAKSNRVGKNVTLV